MKREIKFRAWSEKRKIILMDVQDMYDGLGHWYDNHGKRVDVYEDIYLGGFPTDSFSSYIGREGIALMQYTGLRDVHGKEIYEGDILSVKDKETTGYDEEVGVVAYRGETEPSYAWGWRIEWLQNTHQALMVILTPTASVEVIGNIYEHEHLLTNRRGV